MNTILRILTILLFGTIIFAEGGKISGIVVEKDSGEPLLGVSIIVEGQGIGADSDVNGQFIIINVRPGTYTLKTSYIGYATVKVTNLIVNTGRTSKQNFALKKNAHKDLLYFQMKIARCVRLVGIQPLNKKTAQKFGAPLENIKLVEILV